MTDKKDIMAEFRNGVKDGVKAGGNRMRIFGVIAIILGILCLLAPGLSGVWALTLMGLFVLVAGIVRMIWPSRRAVSARAVDVRHRRADLALRYCTGRQSAVCIRRPDDHAGAVLHP